MIYSVLLENSELTVKCSNMAAAIVYLVELTKLTTGADITYDFVMVDIWGLIQLYLVIVIASIPFLRPLFVDTKAFSWNYYRILLAKYSHRSQSSSGQERRDSSGTDDTLYEKEKGENAAESLPHIPKDRFVTTSLRHAGMESAFDRLSTMETVKSL